MVIRPVYRALLLTTLWTVAPPSAGPGGAEAASRGKTSSPVRLVWHVETSEGDVVGTSHGDDAINPASLVKVATSLWALERLGPGHRFATAFGTDGRLDVESGLLDGDLIVSGSGDPDFHVENAYLVARALNRLGLREIRGALLVDDVFWIGWEGGSAGRATDPSRRARIMASRLRDAWDPRRWNEETRKSIDAFLAREGIDGAHHPRVVVRGAPGLHRGARPARLLVDHRSNRLQAILKRLNAYSNNDIERLGAVLGDGEELAGFLADRWDEPASSLRFETLSGIGVNRLTARGLVRLLGDLQAECAEHGLDIADVLPGAGCDPGTLGNYPRLDEGPMAGALVAKTGTLTQTDGGVAVLGGFVRTGAGERIFCVAAPGSGPNPERARRAQERWLLDLVSTMGGARPGKCGSPVVFSNDDARITTGGTAPGPG